MAKQTLFIFLVSLFHLTTPLLSQNVPILFNHYSGLPGNSVHDCAESNTGKLWIATDKGLAYYDGYTFTKVDLRDNLTTLFSWGFFKDSKGRLWLRNRQAPMTYIYNDSIHRVKNTEHLHDIHFNYFSEDEKGNVYIGSTNSKQTHKIGVDGRVETIDSVLILINSQKKKIWSKHHPYNYEKGAVVGDFVASFLLNNNNEAFIQIKNTITGEEELLTAGFIDGFRHISKLDANHVLLSGKAGIFKLNLETKKITPYNSCYNTTYKDVVVIYKDRYGNNWFCDYTKGLWFEKVLSPSISYTNLGNANDVTSYSSTSDSSITLSTTAPYQYLVKEGSITKRTDRITNEGLEILTSTDIAASFQFWNLEYYYNTAYLMAKKPGKMKRLVLNQWTSYSPDESYCFDGESYKCHFETDTAFHIGTSSGLYSILWETGRIKAAYWHQGYVFDVCATGSFIYSVGLTGLHKTDVRTQKTTLLIDDMNFRNVCVTSKHLIVRKEDGTILMLDIQTHQLLKVYNNYKYLHKIQMVGKEIWGLGESSIVKFDSENLTILLEINSFDGVTAPYKLGIEKVGSTYYLICKNGFYTFNDAPIQKIDYEKNVNFMIQSVFVNGKKLSGDTIFLTGENNLMQVNLQYIYFPFSSPSVLFYYRINKGKWNLSDQPTITIIDPPYGEYELEIKAKFNDNTLSFNKKLILFIHNPPPFHKTNLFLFLIFVLIVIVVAAILIRQRKRKVKQLQQQFDASQNRMKMLIMQMKPHFLSNIFNSLQTSFIENDPIRSSQLITNLDNYLRLSLSYSKKDVVSLYEEIALVKKYLLLEQNRLSKQVQLIISDRLSNHSGSIMVPVFILQPIIENAIWHGIQKSSEPEGKITIDYSEDENYFILSVTDNGIGIGNSNREGNSIALKNINERLSLIDANKRDSYLLMEAANPGTNIYLYVAKKSKNHSH